MAQGQVGNRFQEGVEILEVQWGRTVCPFAHPVRCLYPAGIDVSRQGKLKLREKFGLEL